MLHGTRAGFREEGLDCEHRIDEALCAAEVDSEIPVPGGRDDESRRASLDESSGVPESPTAARGVGAVGGRVQQQNVRLVTHGVDDCRALLRLSEISLKTLHAPTLGVAADTSAAIATDRQTCR